MSFDERAKTWDDDPAKQKRAFAVAAAKLTHLHLLALDLTAGPLPIERYDLIYNLMALHHVPDTNQLLSALSRAAQAERLASHRRFGYGRWLFSWRRLRRLQRF